jgi:hypothetical protein
MKGRLRDYKLTCNNFLLYVFFLFLYLSQFLFIEKWVMDDSSS